MRYYCLYDFWVITFDKMFFLLLQKLSLQISYLFFQFYTKYLLRVWWNFPSYMTDLEEKCWSEFSIDNNKNIEKVLQIIDK